MPNTSATGGTLQPASTPGPKQGQELNRFIQQFIVALSGLDGTLVRPHWQAEPANIPPQFTCWCSFAVTSRKSDTFPYVGHSSTGGTGKDQLRRHEELDVRCSFYDTGTNGLADEIAALTRDNAQIAQNREVLTLNGMGLVSTGDLITAPVLLKERWFYRVDFPMVIRRIIVRDYQVLDLASADISITSQTPGTGTFVESIDVSQ